MKIIISTLLVALAAIGNAQSINIAANDSIKPAHKSIARFKISDVYIQPGFIFLSPPTGSFNDFKTLAPQSVLLKQDFSGYGLDNNGGTGGGLLSIGVTIKIADKKRESYKRNPQIRLGFSYFSGSGLSRYLSKPVIDSVNGTADTSTKNTSMNYEYAQIRFNASLIFSTNERARFSFYGGIGISAGITISAYTEIDAIDTALSTNLTEEVFRNRTGASSYSVFIPGGIDFRIANKNKFWNRVHLFFDFSLIDDAVVIPELNHMTVLGFGVGAGLLGIKWSFNK